MRLLNLLYNPHVRRYIGHNRNSWLVKWLNEFSFLFHRVYENLNYNFSENGEAFILKKIKESTSIKTVFDVGANVGDWSLVANEFFSDAEIHAFEILPNIFPQLENKIKISNNIHGYNVGLSDKEEETFINYVEANSALSSCLNEFSEEFHHIKSTREKCRTTTGDIFCEGKSISKIDFLKIDVEGLESKVLKGFEKMLASNSIRIIQFEYGYASLSSNFYLKDFYSFFKKHNMIIGKIYPTYVDFSPYNYMKEDFIGPNYLAIHEKESELINALKEAQ